jgi:hypothetical protein
MKKTGTDLNKQQQRLELINSAKDYEEFIPAFA